jgi:RHS repeat-associated protein
MSPSRKTRLCHYRYDALDRLIGQAPLDQPAYLRFYCKSRLATEIQGAVQFSIIQQKDLLLAQHQRVGDTLSTRLLATDQQRSVLCAFVDNHKQIAIAYSPYGFRPVENGLTSLLGFNGERADPVTGHYLLGNGYRAFNPGLLRFNGPDNLSPFGRGGLNAYAYCLGDPVNLYDPNGHFSISGRMGVKIGRWSERAKARVAARPKLTMAARSSASADELKSIAKSRSINLSYGNRSIDLRLRGGVTPEVAVQQRAELIDYLHTKPAYYEKYMYVDQLELQQLYNRKMQNRLNDLRYKTDELQFLEYIGSDSTLNGFDVDKVYNIGRRKFSPDVPEGAQRPDLAAKFMGDYNKVYAEKIRGLSKEAAAIREKYFKN